MQFEKMQGFSSITPHKCALGHLQNSL